MVGNATIHRSCLRVLQEINIVPSSPSHSTLNTLVLCPKQVLYFPISVSLLRYLPLHTNLCIYFFSFLLHSFHLFSKTGLKADFRDKADSRADSNPSWSNETLKKSLQPLHLAFIRYVLGIVTRDIPIFLAYFQRGKLPEDSVSLICSSHFILQRIYLNSWSSDTLLHCTLCVSVRKPCGRPVSPACT